MISISELLALDLANLPKNRQGIEYRAKKEAWPFREEVSSGRNGRLKKYLIDSMPSEIRQAVRDKKARELLAKVPALPAAELAPKPAKSGRQLRQLGLIAAEDDFLKLGLDDKQQAAVDARCALIGYVLTLHFAPELKLGIKEAARYVCDQIASGTLPEDKMRYVAAANARHGEKQQGLSFSTLYRWVRDFRSTDDPLARKRLLAPKKTRQKMSLESVVWLPHFLMFYQQPSCPSMRQAARGMAAYYEKEGKLGQMPSYDQIVSVMERLPPVVKERGRKTGLALKQLKPAVKRDWLVLRPNDVWVGDGHSFKAKVRHPVTGQPFVPEFTAVIDGCSAAIMGWSVSFAENTVAVADALRVGMERYGVPLIYYSDNGAGQTAKHLDHDVTGILPRLGVEHATGIPGNAQGRARIERLWEVTAIALARGYPTYQGKDADRETVRRMSGRLDSLMRAEKAGRELSAEQEQTRRQLPTFTQFLADLAEMTEWYNRRHEHGGLPKKPDGRHYAPLEYYEFRLRQEREKDAGFEITRLTELELGFMFRPEETRTAQRGTVRLLNNHYTHDALLAYEGQKVRVAFDLHNAAWVLVKDMDGNPICKAKFEGNTRAAFPVSYVERVAEQRKQRKVQKALAEMEARPALEMQPDYGAFWQPLETADGAKAEVEICEMPKRKKQKLADFPWERTG